MPKSDYKLMALIGVGELGVAEHFKNWCSNTSTIAKSISDEQMSKYITQMAKDLTTEDIKQQIVAWLSLDLPANKTLISCNEVNRVEWILANLSLLFDVYMEKYFYTHDSLTKGKKALFHTKLKDYFMPDPPHATADGKPMNYMEHILEIVPKLTSICGTDLFPKLAKIEWLVIPIEMYFELAYVGTPDDILDTFKKYINPIIQHTQGFRYEPIKIDDIMEKYKTFLQYVDIADIEYISSLVVMNLKECETYDFINQKHIHRKRAMCCLAMIYVLTQSITNYMHITIDWNTDIPIDVLISSCDYHDIDTVIKVTDGVIKYITPVWEKIHLGTENSLGNPGGFVG